MSAPRRLLATSRAALKLFEETDTQLPSSQPAPDDVYENLEQTVHQLDSRLKELKSDLRTRTRHTAEHAPSPPPALPSPPAPPSPPDSPILPAPPTPPPSRRRLGRQASARVAVKKSREPSIKTKKLADTFAYSIESLFADKNSCPANATDIIESFNTVQRGVPNHVDDRRRAFQYLFRGVKSISTDEWRRADESIIMTSNQTVFADWTSALSKTDQPGEVLIKTLESFQGLPDNTPNGYGLARTVLFKLLMTRFAIIWAVRKDEGEQYGITKETKRNITGLNKLLALWVEWGHGVLLYPLWHWKTLCSSTYAAVSERAAHDLYLELNAEQHTAHREQLSRSNEATRESICSLAQTFLGEEASQLVEDSLVLIETFAIHFAISQNEISEDLWVVCK